MENEGGKRNWDDWSKRCPQPNKMARESKEDDHEVCGHLHPRGNTTSKKWVVMMMRLRRMCPSETCEFIKKWDKKRKMNVNVDIEIFRAQPKSKSSFA